MDCTELGSLLLLLLLLLRLLRLLLDTRLIELLCHYIASVSLSLKTWSQLLLIAF